MARAMQLLLLLVACLVALSSAQTTKYYISIHGDDANDCTSSAAPCETLQGVVDLLPPPTGTRVDYTVEVDSGSYTGDRNIQVDISSLNLALTARVGTLKESVVFDCANNYDEIFKSTASLSLTNITLANCPTGVTFVPPEGATTTTFVTFHNVAVTGCSVGLNALAGDVTVTNSLFSEIGMIGIAATNVQGFVLTGTEFYQNAQWGVHMYTNHSLIAEHGIIFSDCDFIGGGGISLSTGVRFDFDNLTFKGITSENAIRMQEGSHSGSNITITESDIRTAIYYHSTSANTAAVALSFVDVIISDVHTAIEFDTMGGGTVSISSATLLHTVDAIVAYSVGSFALYSSSILEATNSSVQIASTTTSADILISNVQIQHSGPVTANVAATAVAKVTDCYVSAAHGHAFDVTGGSWTFSKCTVIGAEPDLENVARGFYLLGRNGESSSFNINDSIFRNITNEQGLGGGVYISGTSIAIDGCIFENNKADSGGAVALEHYSTATISNSVFIQNVADDAGGAIELDSNGGTVTIANCTFEGNVAQIGAAIDCCSVEDGCSVSFSEPSSAPNIFQGNVNSNQDTEPVNCGVDHSSDGASAWAWIFGILATIVFIVILGAAAFIAYRSYNRSRHQDYETL